MNPFKKLAGQTAIYGLPTIVGRLLNYLLVPLYTRTFLTAEYGVVTEMYAYVAFIYVILSFGMETAFFRFLTQDNEHKNVFGTSVLSLIFTSTLFTLFGFIFSGNISQFMGYPEHPEYIRWFILILATDAISTIPYANLRFLNKPFRFALVKIVNITTNIGFNLFFIVLCPYLLTNSQDSTVTSFIQKVYDPDMGIGYIFISNLIASVLSFVMLLPEILRIKLKFDFKLLRNMLAYAWPLLIFGLAGIVNETFDRVILKHLLPESSNPMSQLGIYGACYKVSILMTLFIQTYRYAVEPFFFDHSRNANAKETYARLMHYFIIICLLIFLAIMLFEDIVILFIGPEFREGRAVIPILLMANLFLGVFYNLSVWFKLTNNTRKGATISIIGAIITLILNFILIPVMGYMGAAWATLACYLSMMVISYVIGQKYYAINYDLKGAGVYLAVALSLYGLSAYLHADSPMLNYSVGFLLLLLFLGIVVLRERHSLRILLKKA
ncbi:MAG: polysaccharide biosynthesis C-terminal domain-containing protein [Lentimicrobium sp.]|nr:polysaccharide biosynthesis C-terminal domain-containing protein [Lentimicrobium sp.]